MIYLFTTMKELDVTCIESDEEENGEPEIICIEDEITNKDPSLKLFATVLKKIAFSYY